MNIRDLSKRLNIKFNYISDKACDKKKKFKLSRFVTKIGAITVVTIPLLVRSVATDKYDEMTDEYKYEIDEYNKEIDRYAKYINSLNLNELETIIKVMNDMWSNIDGYKNQSDDIYGYYRLNLYEDSYGVCRHMTDDFAARINAINPDYEACSIYVTIEQAETNQIERTMLEDSNNNEQQESDESSKIFANHAVVCIKSREEEALLIIDPTNPSIGVFKNGKIEMFATESNNILDAKIISNFLIVQTYEDDYFNKYFESFTTRVDMEYLKEKYGLEAQNKTLEYIDSEYDTDNYNTKRKHK